MQRHLRADDTRPSHKIAAVIFPGVYFERDEWDFIVDISEYFEKRVEAEAQYTSQGHSMEWSHKRMEITLGNAGWFSGTSYAEGFVQESPFVHSKIELPKVVFQEAEESESTRHHRMIGGTGVLVPSIEVP